MRSVALVAVVLFGAACEPGQLFGPDMVGMTIDVAVEKMVCDDDLEVSVNGEDVFPNLTRDDPVHTYRVRVQVLERYWTNSRYYVERGEIQVELYSTRFSLLKTKRDWAYEDEVVKVVFNYVSAFGVQTLRGSWSC